MISARHNKKRYLSDSKQAKLQMGAVSDYGDIESSESTHKLINAIPELTL